MGYFIIGIVYATLEALITGKKSAEWFVVNILFWPFMVLSSLFMKD